MQDVCLDQQLWSASLIIPHKACSTLLTPLFGVKDQGTIPLQPVTRQQVLIRQGRIAPDTTGQLSDLIADCFWPAAQYRQLIQHSLNRQGWLQGDIGLPGFAHFINI